VWRKFVRLCRYSADSACTTANCIRTKSACWYSSTLPLSLCSTTRRRTRMTSRNYSYVFYSAGFVSTLTNCVIIIVNIITDRVSNRSCPPVRLSARPSVRLSVRFHSIFATAWPLYLSFCGRFMSIARLGFKIPGQGQRRGNAVKRSVWPRSSIEDSFSCYRQRWNMIFLKRARFLSGSKIVLLWYSSMIVDP